MPASSELDVEEMSSPSSVETAAVNSYDSMSRAELRACCGKKHGNSISASKKVNEGLWKPKSKKEMMSDLKNAAMVRSKHAFFSKQRSAPSSMASTSASSTASSSTGSSSQRIAQPLAGSELDVEEKSSPSSVDLAAVNSYDSMSRAELKACCGKKHGNSITNDKKDNEGRWKPKSKKQLMSELKNAAMLRSKSGGSKQGLAALFSKQSSVAISTAVNSYDSMSKAELRACCGKKHGNSITVDK